MSEKRISTALAEAVSALYAPESSDMKEVLWRVVGILGGPEAKALLRNFPKAAYQKYVGDQDV